MEMDPRVEREAAVPVYAREAVLKVMHEHNGWPAPHMANDELLDLAEATARAAIKAWLGASPQGDAQPQPDNERREM